MVHSYIRQFSRLAAQQGIRQLSFYLEEEQGRQLSVYQGSCDKLNVYQQTSLFIEGEYQGFCGSVFVEHFEDSSELAAQLSILKETALAWKKPFVPKEYPQLEQPKEESSRIPAQQVLERLCQAEAAAYGQDRRVSSVIHCGCQEKHKRVTLLDQAGHQVSDSWSSGQFYLDLSARAGSEVQQSLFSRNYDPRLPMPDLREDARRTAARSVTKLGAASCRTGQLPTLLTASVVCQLLDAFLPTFFAKNIQNHMSVLEGKAGQQIGAEGLRLYEEPGFPGGLPRRFDDEGVLCTQKDLIRDGCFAACLYNRASARAAGTVSGGNGFKSTFSDEVDTAYTNVILAPGDASRERLLAKMGTGLLIDDISGLHSGANPVSGDFSLIAKGYRVEQGRLGRGVTQITVAGNFFELLSRVRSLGDRLESMSGPKGYVFGPDVLVERLMISGTEA